MTVVRIKATGQVIDMVPRAAHALIGGGTAEAVTEKKVVETAMRQGQGARAVAPAQTSAKRRKAGTR